MHILLADDDESTLILIAKTLKGSGHQVTCLNDGKELLLALTHGPAASDIVITDHQMPGGPSGIDVLRVLRRDKKFDELPIIVHSACVHVREEVVVLRAIFAEKVLGYTELFDAVQACATVLHYRSHP